jgi:tetratricopeptide (TPR) repeat protein
VRFPLDIRVRHDLARLEEAERNWPGAERAWRAFGALNPVVWWGHTQLAQALLGQGRVAEADALVADLRAQFPQDVGVFSEYARMAEWRDDWPEAAVRWLAVADRFPETSAGPAGRARALLMQGNRAEARALLLETLAHFPAETDPRIELARLEEKERNWIEAERGWREFAALRPSVWWGPARVAAALREQGRIADADEALADALDRFPNELALFIDLARLAEFQRDWPAAAERWAVVTERFPASWEALAGQARALREQGRREEARALLIEAVTRFPSASGPLHDLARLHEAERNWPEAEKRWLAFVALEPSPWWGHAGLANALVEQGRLDQAEAVLAGQFERMAGEPALFIAHARLADRAANWAEAERRWTDVAARFPHMWEGFGGRVRSLRHQQRLREASAVLAEDADRFTGLDGPLRERAELAEAMGDWATAQAAWRSLVATDQSLWWFYAHLMRAECKQARIQAAFATFAEAQARFPKSLDIVIAFVRSLIEEGCVEPAQGLIADAMTDRYDPTAQELLHLAWMALGSENLDGAIAIIHRLRLIQPSESPLADNFGHLENTLKIRIAELAPEKLGELGGAHDTAQAAGLPAEEETSAVNPQAVAASALMMRFESLGGDAPGCEIGLVQRKFGAEPLGLLRWTSVAPDQLIEAMRTGFEGVGSPEQTELVVAGHGSYRTRDKRFDMEMLTFCRPSEIEFSRMRQRALRRISFLREKLLRDLAGSDKIFIYRTLRDTMTHDEISQLKAAMNRYGCNRLLYIKLADEEHPIGSISVEAPDLCFGYVEAFSHEPLSELHMNGWLPVFEQADAYWPTFQPEEPSAIDPEYEGSPAVVPVVEAPVGEHDWTVAEVDEPPPVVPAAEMPAKESSWLQRVAGLFGSHARH